MSLLTPPHSSQKELTLSPPPQQGYQYPAQGAQAQSAGAQAPPAAQGQAQAPPAQQVSPLQR